MAWAARFRDERVALLTLEGRINRTDLSNLAARLSGIAARGMQDIVVDARGVEHWDFRGLPALADAMEDCKRRGSTVAVVTPNPYLHDIAKAVGVYERLNVYDDLDLTGEPHHHLTVVNPPTNSQRRVGR